MRHLLAPVLFAVLGVPSAFAEQPPPGMATYQVVLLKRTAAADSAGLRKEHLAYVDRLEKDGVVVAAGPVPGSQDLLGVAVMSGVDTARARELVAADPAVKAGGAVAKVLPWWGPDNIGAKYRAARAANPPAEPKAVTYQLAILRAGPKRDQPPALAEDIQKAHMAHIESMAEAGKLVAAGPFAEEDDLRGIFLFAATPDEARALTSQDPAVKAGRMVMDLYPWVVPEGVFVPTPR